MTDIKQIKISLMERTGDIKEEVSKADYVIKCSATLKFNEYIDIQFPGADDEDRQDILMQASKAMYDDLLERSKFEVVDSVGVWLTIGDKIYENSISLSTLVGIQEYAEKDTVPIFELIKMTIPINE